MTTSENRSTRDTMTMSDETEAPTTTNRPQPITPKGSDAPRAWDLMRGRHHAEEVHPYWTHIVSTAGTTLLAASLLALAELPVWGWVLALIGLAWCGGMLGSALTWRSDLHVSRLGQAFGAVWFTATGVLAMVMAATGFVGHAFTAAAQPAWLTWAAMAGVGSIVHRYLWGRAVELADPTHPRGAAQRVKRNNDLWSSAFRDAGLGEVTVEQVTESWSGMDVVGRTDPAKITRLSEVEGKAEAVVDLAHKALRDSGSELGLGIGEAEVHGGHNGQRDKFLLRVKTRDPLVETIQPEIPARDEFAIRDSNVGMLLGYWDTGDDLIVPPAGPHKAAAGATGSGKSTWFIALQVGYARRPHWTMVAAGTSKLMDLVGPIQTAAQEVEGRPLLSMWGGGDSGTAGELSAAERTIAAMYVLYRDRAHRSSKGRLAGRVGKTFVGTPECPWVALFCDEYDDMLKKSSRKIKLPTGEKMDLFEMLVQLGSKARAYGIELILASQGTNDGAMGAAGGVRRASNDLLTNCNTRFLFATSRGAAIQDILGDSTLTQKGKRLENMDFACMASIRGQKDKFNYGKVALWEEEDLVEVTRLANELGTVGGFGEADRVAMGELFVQGAQPQRSPDGAAPRKPDTSAADESKWGTPQTPAERSEMAAKLLRDAGGSWPADDEQEQDVDDVEPDEDEPAWADDVLAQIADMPELSQEQLDAMRARHSTPQYPEEPEVLLGDVLDSWAALPTAPHKLTAKEIVAAFDLYWLDVSGEGRREQARAEGHTEQYGRDLVAGQAASKLGEILRAEPIAVEPRKTNRGMTYRLSDLRAAYDRIMDVSGEDTE